MSSRDSRTDAQLRWPLPVPASGDAGRRGAPPRRSSTSSDPPVGPPTNTSPSARPKPSAEVMAARRLFVAASGSWALSHKAATARSKAVGSGSGSQPSADSAAAG